MEVDMESLKDQQKLYLIDNYGYTRSDEITSTVVYYCFINNCEFETTNIGELIGHSDTYKAKWFGFCYKCNAQIYDKKVPLITELLHMTQCHKIHENGIGITVHRLPQDNKFGLQNALNTARAERRSGNPIPLTYGDSCETSRDVSLTPWRKPTLKAQNKCRKMLQERCLCALFKCMEINCIFFTASARDMLAHLQYHENGTDSKMDNPSQVSSWLECAYCDLISDSCSSLVQHIWVEHSASLYQCPYCFYRSCEVYNVVFHLKQFHQTLKELVLVCNGNEMEFEAEKTVIEQYRSKNIRPLRCYEACKKITYVMDYFINHMKCSIEHYDNFKCQFCGSSVLISEATKHFLCHNIGVYQCIYCIHGTNTLDSMQNHMCNTHPNRLLYLCVRLTRNNRILRDEELCSVEGTILSQLGDPVDSKLLKRFPFTDEHFIGDLLHLTTSSNSTSPILSTNNPSSQCQQMTEILDYSELEREYTSDDWDNYFATQLPSLPIDESEIAIDAPAGEIDTAVHNLLQANVLQSKIDDVAYNLVRQTGLEGSELYRCSLATCNEMIDNLSGFEAHLQKHLKHKTSAMELKCYHCLGEDTEFTAENIDGLTRHIQSHGIHRYFCYICTYTCAFEDKDHIRQKHEQNHSKTVALNPMKEDVNKDMFVLCGVAPFELGLFGRSLIEWSKEYSIPSNNSDHKPLQIQESQIEMHSESIPFDDASCNITASTPSNETEECNAPVEERKADNVDVIIAEAPITEEHMNSPITIVSDDEGEAKKSTAVTKIVVTKKAVTKKAVTKKAVTKKVLSPKKVGKGNATSAKDPRQNNARTKQLTEPPKLYEIITYRCIYCTIYEGDLGKLYTHWKTNHVVPNLSRFMFQIAKLFRCCYCRVCDTYDKLKVHCDKLHKDLVFAVVDITNRQKCGLCDHQFRKDEPADNNEIIDHFNKFHDAKENITIQPDDYLTDELLDRIIAEKNPHCDQKTSQIMYGCSRKQCTETNCKQDETVAHIRKEFLQFQCNYCDEQLKKISLVKEHHKIVHKIEDETYRYRCMDACKKNYLKMKIIFPNGLMLTKRDCKYTRFGAMDDVITKVREIDDRELKEVHKQQQVENDSDSKPSSKEISQIRRGRRRRRN